MYKYFLMGDFTIAITRAIDIKYQIAAHSLRLSVKKAAVNGPNTKENSITRYEPYIVGRINAQNAYTA